MTTKREWAFVMLRLGMGLWVVLAAVALLPGGVLAQENVIKVGAVMALTGPAANFGTGVRNGMELAYRKLSPEERARIKIYYEDDAFNPKNSITAFNRLREQYQVEIVVNTGSQTGKALAPLAELPLIAIASDPEVVAGKKHVVNFWVTPDEEMQALLPYMVRRGYKKAARISSIHDFPVAMKAAFDRINAGRVELLMDEEYPGEVKDFRPFITKLKSRKDVDAVVVILMPGHAGVFAKQLRQMGCALPMVGMEFFEDPEEVRVSEGALIGQRFISAADPGESFAAEYLKAYPGAALYGAPNGYDIVMLLAEALRKGKRAEELNEYLHSFKDFSGSMGTYSATGNNTFTLPAAIKVVTKEGFEQTAE
jgi:branched-chain amino acid transport system substrate-binding protein